MRQPRPHATDRVRDLRVEEILRIRLDGAEFHDLREYVREKEGEEGSPWKLADGEQPMCDRTIRRYAAAADRLICQSVSETRERVIALHLGRRRNLYGRAVTSGDLRTALAVLRDEALLLGLYPADPSAPTAPPVQVVIEIVEEVRRAEAPPARAATPSRN